MTENHFVALLLSATAVWLGGLGLGLYLLMF
jgi:hypothetical protein